MLKVQMVYSAMVVMVDKMVPAVMELLLLLVIQKLLLQEMVQVV